MALTRQADDARSDQRARFGDLGMHLMRTGDEAEARRALERAFKADPFDKVTYNLLVAARHARQVRRRTRRRPRRQDASRRSAGNAGVRDPARQDALKTLSAKYQFTPKGPILIEMFPQHDDFAVRTSACPG